MKTIFPLLLLIPFAYLRSQQVAVYFDYKKSFFVFDAGIYKELENTPVTSYAIGNDFVAYLNKDNDLKYYCKGESTVIEEIKPESYICSQNFLVYKMKRRLVKIENNQAQTLCEWASDYAVGDSIIAFTDYGDTAFKVYYNGEIKTIASGVRNGDIRQYRVSKNLIVYSDGNNNTKVWWHGRSYLLFEGIGSGYDVGMDVVGFQDPGSREFKIFYRGEIFQIDQAFIKSFRVANSAVAYVDMADNFNVFYKGETILAATHSPDSYSAAGDIIYFQAGNEEKLLFNGKIYLLDNIPKTDYLTSWNARTDVNESEPKVSGYYLKNSVLFYDKMGREHLLNNGTIVNNILFDTKAKLEKTNDLFVYTDELNRVTVFYKGKAY